MVALMWMLFRVDTKLCRARRVFFLVHKLTCVSHPSAHRLRLGNLPKAMTKRAQQPDQCAHSQSGKSRAQRDRKGEYRQRQERQEREIMAATEAARRDTMEQCTHQLKQYEHQLKECKAEISSLKHRLDPPLSVRALSWALADFIGEQLGDSSSKWGVGTWAQRFDEAYEHMAEEVSALKAGNQKLKQQNARLRIRNSRLRWRRALKVDNEKLKQQNTRLMIRNSALRWRRAWRQQNSGTSKAATGEAWR